MRKRSAETKLRETRKMLRACHKQMFEDGQTNARLGKRATTAEHDLAEWKARFDELLKRVPEVKP
jgi:hypothetical protein